MGEIKNTMEISSELESRPTKVFKKRHRRAPGYSRASRCMIMEEEELILLHGMILNSYILKLRETSRKAKKL